ncbi:MAG: metallophosphoesterase family protein [Acidobacteria bacterium]|nr:metallophosphoesterase family protein [Acidobacteriota bacterium]
MKYLILTDIHGNAEALEAVLEDARGDSIDSVLVLGDLVGYGAGPNEVIAQLLDLAQPIVVIRGNHDTVVATPLRDAHFNFVARRALRWTAQALTAENLEYLARLPRGPIEVAPGLFVCHGSPLDEDEYVISFEDAANVFSNHAGALTFFGHTHIPTCFTARDGELSSLELKGDGVSIQVEPGTRYLANPGSVGQPRDRDPRAAYFVYDSARAQIEWRRCDYAIEAAQRSILEAGLPEVLAHRLAIGI